MPPLRVGELAEAAVDQAQMRLELGQILEGQVQAEIGADLCERRLRHEWPDIVDHQPSHRRPLAGGQHDPDQAAHRGADPVDLGNAHDVEQARDLRGIDRHVVLAGIGQPAAVAPAGHVHRQHPAAAGRQQRGQHVEIVRVAREAVHADHRPRRRGVAVLEIAELESGEIGA